MLRQVFSFFADIKSDRNVILETIFDLQTAGNNCEEIIISSFF